MRKVLTLVSVTLFVVLALVSIQSFARSSSKAKTDLAVKQEIAAASESAAEASSATAARCPNIHKAVGALETALHDMEIAKNDFCGHKAEAMEATRHALEQLRRAEDCDQCR